MPSTPSSPGPMRTGSGESAHRETVGVDEESFCDDQSDVMACLQEPTPRIPAWFGYDALGSQLFESITQLPTYYLTRVEKALLHQHAAEMAELIDCPRIAELGSGSAKKTRLLLTGCLEQRPTTYLPIDVSREMLETSGAALQAELPALTVHALWGRYEAGLQWLRGRASHPVAVALLGSNLGNATLAERDALLADIAATLRPADQFLVSVDLDKPAEVFETCYNDPAGRSAFALFRLNHLTHLNRRFSGDFVLDGFHPRAHYDPATAVVEGHLYATRAQSASLADLGLTLNLRHGESINVGFSAKFDRIRFVADITSRGFALQAEWTDAAWQYGIFLFRRT